MRMPQKFCEITTLDLSYVVPVKSTVEIWQNFVAFSEYMNFNKCFILMLKELFIKDFGSFYFCKRLEEKTFVNNLPHTNIEIGDKLSSFHLVDW